LQYSIREVIAFPFMKEEQKKEKLAAEVVGIEPKPIEEVRKYREHRFLREPVFVLPLLGGLGLTLWYLGRVLARK
jgi:hypothetical protein